MDAQNDDILAGLEAIRDKGPSDPRIGICSNLEDALLYLDADVNEFDWLAEQFHYAGLPSDYPVPGGCTAYDSFSEDKWDGDGSYAQNRRALLDWLIERAKGNDPELVWPVTVLED